MRGVRDRCDGRGICVSGQDRCDVRGIGVSRQDKCRIHRREARGIDAMGAG